MKTKRYVYGLMGLLSLLGLVGVFTEERSFLAFFAFAVDFSYFFMKTDEMLEETMSKSASSAFCLGMIATAVVTLAHVLGAVPSGQALVTGITVGWAVSVMVFALATAFFGFRENWGLHYD